MDVSVQFHLNPAQALEVFNKLGPNYDDTIVHPLVRTAVRDAASEFTATQLVDQRGELQTRMSNLVRHQLSTTLRGRQISESAIVVDNILLRNIDLPNTLDEAIARVQQERQATQQRTQARQTAEQEAARIRIEAQGQSEAMLVRTRADTEAQLLRARAEAESNRHLSQSLTPNILSLRQIEATRALLGSNQTRTIMVPSNAGLNLLMPNLVPTN
jgi:regulator of protease activity HflC (stomatin/prohibitin superfamily)